MMGGLVSILLLVGRIVTKPLVKISFKAKLLNELLEFEFQKSKENKINQEKENNNNNENYDNNNNVNDNSNNTKN